MNPRMQSYLIVFFTEYLCTCARRIRTVTTCLPKYMYDIEKTCAQLEYVDTYVYTYVQ